MFNRFFIGIQIIAGEFFFQKLQAAAPLSGAQKSLAQQLSKLHDIHLPKPVSWWPLASGWYLLASFIALLLLLLFFGLRTYCLNTRARRKALTILAQYYQQFEQDEETVVASSRISELLKRVALAYFPREHVAGLQGDAWLKFLNGSAKKADFSFLRMELLELPYFKDKVVAVVPEAKIDLLFRMARIWILERRKPCLN